MNTYELDFTGSNFDASQVLVWHTNPTTPLVTLPVLSIVCFICQRRAAPGAAGVALSRINGDSRYGYETHHVACWGVDDWTWEPFCEHDTEDLRITDCDLCKSDADDDYRPLDLGARVYVHRGYDDQGRFLFSAEGRVDMVGDRKGKPMVHVTFDTNSHGTSWFASNDYTLTVI